MGWRQLDGASRAWLLRGRSHVALRLPSGACPRRSIAPEACPGARLTCSAERCRAERIPTFEQSARVRPVGKNRTLRRAQGRSERKSPRRSRKIDKNYGSCSCSGRREHARRVSLLAEQSPPGLSSSSRNPWLIRCITISTLVLSVVRGSAPSWGSLPWRS